MSQDGLPIIGHVFFPPDLFWFLQENRLTFFSIDHVGFRKSTDVM